MVKLKIFLLKMSHQVSINPLNYLKQMRIRLLHPWPSKRIIIQYPIQYFTQAPVRICLNLLQIFLWQRLQLLALLKCLIVNFGKVTQVDNNKRSHHVIYPLHVSTCWMPHMPYIKYPAHCVLNPKVTKQRTLR